jgi:PAS domain S-box-containing protein
MVIQLKHTGVTSDPSQEDNQQILEALECGILCFSPEGQLTYLNPTAILYAEQLRFPKDCTKTLSSFIETCFAYIKDANPHASSYALFINRLHQQGVLKETFTFDHQRSLSLSAKIIDNQSIILTLTDVSDFLIKQQEMSERERRFRRYMELSPVGAILVRLNGHVRYFNPRLKNIFGYNSDEMQSVQVAGFYEQNNSRQKLIDALRDRPGQPCSFHFQGKRKNGESFPMLLTSELLEFDGEQMVFSWVVDLTELNNATDEINQLHFQNQLILNTAGAGIVGLDQNFNIQFINPAGAQMLGFNAEELVDTSLLNLLDPNAPLPDEANISQACIKSETVLKTKDNKCIPVKFTLTSAVDETSHFHQVFVFDDISERVAAQEALYQAMEDIEQSSQAKSHFLSTMSHELRTPLNAILGFTQIMSMNVDDNLKPKQLGFLDHINNAGQHLLSLINEAIDIAAIETGKVALSMQPVSIKDVFASCIKEQMHLAAKNHIELNVDTQSNNNTFIYADHARFAQVLNEFISNAIKYTQTGGNVTIGCEEVNDTQVRIFVQDNGPGFEYSNKDDIFTPFNRLDAVSKNITGTGLGLTLCKQMTQLMGGIIDFETKLDHGSRFWVDFPITKNDRLTPPQTTK